MAISSTKDRAPIIWSKSLVATLLNHLWYWMKHLRNQAIKQHEITARFPAAMNGLFLWGNCTRTSRLTSSKRLSKADREKCQPCPRNQHRGNFAFPVCSAGSANPSFYSFDLCQMIEVCIRAWKGRRKYAWLHVRSVLLTVWVLAVMVKE